MRQKLLMICFLMGALLFGIGNAMAQTRTITGTVTGQDGKPISGASVFVTGTPKVGTTTDENGHYQLRVPEGVKTLTITSLGNTVQTLPISNGPVTNISLIGKDSELDSVVVVAYGTQKKVNLTGSVAIVGPKQIEDKPFTSVDKALQGAVAGLQSSSANGIPGSATDIVIRGIGSINASNSPLWVIDGVIATTGDLTSNTTTANALSGLNSDDIESISVLKDASATAIYGSRGANGVILVTTKSGKAGKTKVNLSVDFGRNSIARTSDKNRPMTTSEYQTVLRQSLINAGYASDNADADALIIDPNDGLGFDPNWLNTNTDWLKEVTRTGNQQQFNLSLSGGNEKNQYYASAGYFNQDGTTIATYFKRYNGSLSLTSKINDRITVKTGINGSTSTQLSPPGSAAYASPVSGAYFIQPWYSPYNSDGSYKYNDSLNEFPDGSQFNPVLLAAWNKSTNNQVELRGYLSGEYQILNNLKFTSKYSAEYFNINEYSYWNPIYGDGSADGGDAYAFNTRIFNWTWTNQLNYHLDLNNSRDFYLDLLGGTESYAQTNTLLYTSGSSFPQTLALQYLASAATPTSTYYAPTEKSVVSYFSNGTLNYKNRYVLSSSFRRDGSSVFAKKWGNFWSVGGAWNISEEEFFKDVNVISLLKLRASYGVSGNTMGFGAYSAFATYGYGSPYAGSAGSEPNNVGNTNLTWEKNKPFNIGLDFGLWRNRLTGTVEYYNRKTTDLLLNVPLSPTSGFSGGQLQNVGSMSNKGIEITLSGRPIVTKDFTWESSFNFSHNTNRVLKLYNNSPVSINTRFNATEGHDIYEFYTRRWAGVDVEDGRPLWYKDATGNDTTHNSNIAQLSLTGKSATPKFYGGFTNTFTYKEFSLVAQLYYNFGNYIYNTWENYLSSDGTYYGAMNQMSLQLTAWQKPGDVTNVPQLIFGGNNNSNRPSTRYLYKGDYIRLRDLQLLYNVPMALLTKAKISSLSLYVRATNLLTFATDKYLPIDPEMGTNSINDFQVFTPKTVSIGLKLGL